MRLVMSQEREILNNNDVVSVVDLREAEFVSGNTLKIQQLLGEYKEYVEEARDHNCNSTIYTQGIECEVLRQDTNSKGWRTGKIKFVVQFEPYAVESSKDSNTLDDIRKQIDTTS